MPLRITSRAENAFGPNQSTFSLKGLGGPKIWPILAQQAPQLPHARIFKMKKRGFNHEATRT
jgi:hypothetical protein